MTQTQEPAEEPQEPQAEKSAAAPGGDGQPQSPTVSLEDLQELVMLAAGAIEKKLVEKLDQTILSLNEKIDNNAKAALEITANAKKAMETVPNVIQEHVEAQLKSNLTGIVKEVGDQFEAKIKSYAGGGNGAAAGDFFEKMIGHSDKIIGIINAFRSPTTEQAMLSQMNFVMRWHQVLSKLEKGGGSGTDVTKAIAETFKSPE